MRQNVFAAPGPAGELTAIPQAL